MFMRKRCQRLRKDMFKLLAVVFACNRFHDYIYDRQVTIETDQKPLETLFKICLSTIPQRFQKMMMQLQRCDRNVVYMKGTELCILDMLSQAHLEETLANEEGEYEVLMVTPMALWKMDELKRETASDPVLVMLITTINNLWSESLKETDSELQLYFNFRDQLTLQNDIVFKDEKILVPRCLKLDNQIHLLPKFTEDILV